MFLGFEFNSKPLDVEEPLTWKFKEEMKLYIESLYCNILKITSITLEQFLRYDTFKNVSTFVEEPSISVITLIDASFSNLNIVLNLKDCGSPEEPETCLCLVNCTSDPSGFGRKTNVPLFSFIFTWDCDCTKELYFSLYCIELIRSII